MKRFSITIVLLLTSVWGISQTALLDRANEAYDDMAYSTAVALFERVAKKDPSAEVCQKLGYSYAELEDSEKAEEWYARALIHKPQKPELIYDYAMVLRENKKYEESELWMKKYMEKNPDEIRTLMYQSNNLTGNGKEGTFKLKHLEDINSEFSDFGVFPWEDKLVFTSSRNSILPRKGTDIRQGSPYLKTYVYDSLSGNERKRILPFLSGLKLKFHHGPVFITKDGICYFTASHANKGKVLRDEQGITQLKILQANLKEDKDPELISLNEEGYSIGHPAISADGKRFYFSSNMPGGFGGSDLYVSIIKSDGSFGKPINLGAVYNTEGDELFPMISEKGDLYFASDGRGGLGGLDLFIAKKGNSFFLAPQNLGPSINSHKDDFSMRYINDTSGYFASNRPGGLGMDDIYSFSIEEPFHTWKKVIVTVVDENGNPLNEITYRLLNSEESTVELLTTSDEELFIVRPNKDYSLVASKDEYDDKVVYFSSSGPGNEIVLNLVLAAEKIEQEIVADAPMEDSSHVEAEISQADDKTLVETVVENVVPKESSHTTSPPASEEIIAKGEPKGNEELVSNVTVEKFNSIYFDFDQSKVRSDAFTELDKIVDFLKQNASIRIDVVSHTDSRGDAQYNLWLSKKRAKATANYIINKVGDAHRVRNIKGVGESQLLNGCDDDSQCSEEEHQLNRRTEFMIVRSK